MNLKKEHEKLDQRKKDHINLALDSQVLGTLSDSRFYYEPMLGAHALKQIPPPFVLAGKQMTYPIWVSSMTGGTAYAGEINKRLARACKEFGLGMGLGSCRIILNNNTYFEDFNLRPIIGNKAPLFANLGIAQIESALKTKKWDQVNRMISKLKADGLIIHVNPLQEWLQPEGDTISLRPVDTIAFAMQNIQYPVIVKEVGQGMGPESLKALMSLSLEAIEFAALGGTNFSLLELKRGKGNKSPFNQLSEIGHTADEMTGFINRILSNKKAGFKCMKFIISGGVKDFLDGYYLMNKLKAPSIYGQASVFLLHAKKDYSSLYNYIKSQIDGLSLAHNYLNLK